MVEERIAKFRQLINQAENIVFFGGAGVSTASGIPDFRSATGLYNQRYSSRYDPETILSHSFFITHPKEFYDFHLQFLAKPNVQPNATHLALTELERLGKLKAIITQNIDGLHQRAGSHGVIELHGNAYDFFCMKCLKHFDLDFVLSHRGLPRCAHCGGIVRPNVVLYEEPLDSHTINQSINALQSANLLIVGGTSLVVYPAAGMINYYRGKEMVLINRDVTAYDSRASLVFHEDISEVLTTALDREN